MKTFFSKAILLALALTAVGYADAAHAGGKSNPGIKKLQKKVGQLSTDVSFLKGAVSNPGQEGPVGPMGPQGLQGPKGDKGDQGERGVAGVGGPEGPVGPTGAQGPQGLKGDRGDKGDKGDPGSAGQDGAQGPTGPQGPAGLGFNADACYQLEQVVTWAPTGYADDYREASLRCNDTIHEFATSVEFSHDYAVIAPLDGRPFYCGFAKAVPVRIVSWPHIGDPSGLRDQISVLSTLLPGQPYSLPASVCDRVADGEGRPDIRGLEWHWAVTEKIWCCPRQS